MARGTPCGCRCGNKEAKTVVVPVAEVPRPGWTRCECKRCGASRSGCHVWVRLAQWISRGSICEFCISAQSTLEHKDNEDWEQRSRSRSRSAHRRSREGTDRRDGGSSTRKQETSASVTEQQGASALRGGRLGARDASYPAPRRLILRKGAL